jgi:hypothetical protein
MAYARHTLFTFGGKIGTAPNLDAWQCGIRLRIAQTTNNVQGVDASLTNPGGYLTAVVPALKTWFGKLASSTAGSEFMSMRQDATLEWAKCNNIKPALDSKGHATGIYSDLTHVNRYDWATPYQQGASGATAPPFVTLAVSLLTSNQRGPGHRGRMYLPVALPSVPSGKLASSYCVQANGTLKQLLVLLEAQADGGTPGGVAVQACIASKLDASLNKITGIATGDVVDVQRRRKEQIPEAYTTIAYP